nr:TBC1 domain family member 2B-like [Ciona intestinalis]|eukprot:XP_009861938.1 TBC1 domain family member 2B-like [Ciona intestinalis]
MAKQGWLKYRQKGGLVGRIAGFREHRLWFVLYENCTISGYKDENTGTAKPDVVFDLRHSAVTINQEENYQFELISDKHNVVMLAEDYDDVKDWVSAIQTTRSIAHGVSPAPKKTQRKTSNTDSISIESGSYKMSMPPSPLDSNSNGHGDEYEWDNPITPADPSPVSLTSNMDEQGALFQLSKELSEAKAELTKCRDRITSYQEVLASRDQQLFEIQDQINNQETNEKSRAVTSEGYHNMEEQARSYREQNCLLNEEVLKLHQMCQKYKDQAHQQRRKADKLAIELRRTQRDYVSVMGHCVYHPLVDVEEDVRFMVSEPNRHVANLKNLSKTMKSENDRILGCSIPTLGKTEHTDMFGFIHNLPNEVLQIEYLCSHLTEAYDALLDASEENQKLVKKWKSFMHEHSEKFEVTPQLQKLILQCMPAHYRSYIWQKFIHYYVLEIKQGRGDSYYEELLKHQEIYKLDRDFSKSFKQIMMDVPRTMPGNRDFTTQDSPLRDRLTRVLTAFCIHAPKIGYCQGFNFLAGASLLFLEEVDAFWFIIAVIEVIFPEDYYRNGLAGLLADQYVLQKIIPLEIPKLNDHLTKYPEVDIAAVTTGWFLGLFFDCLPFKTLIRVWDCFLAFGHEAVFRVSCAILKQFEDRLLELHEPSHLLHAIKNIPKLCTHPEQLIKEAFEGLHHFPSWSEIKEQRAKLEVELIEEHEKKMQQRRHYDERMMMLDHFEDSNILPRNEDKWNFECATSTPSGFILLSASNRMTQNSRLYISDCTKDAAELLALPVS